MKTYKHLFEESISPEVVRIAALDAAQGKVNRPEVMRALLNFDKTYDIVTAAAQDPGWEPDETNTRRIIDGANGKPRTIEKPPFCPEQILHHMLIESFKPVLLNGLYEQVYGCLPATVEEDKGQNKRTIRKFGPHAAIRRLTKWAQCGKKLYVAELDVHHAYRSVDIPTLAAKLKRVIKDPRWLALAFKFIHYDGTENCGDGLVLGHYTSPWFFNFYLKDFDHYVAALGVDHYLRYADNLFLLDSNKRRLRRAVFLLNDYLHNELHLELNRSRQIFRFEYIDRNGRVRGRAINALGAVIHCNRVTMRKSSLCRARRKSMRIKKKERCTWHDASSMLSRLGMFRHTNCHRYYEKHIKVNINTRNMKRKIRAHSKAIQCKSMQRRQMINDALEKSTRLSG